MADDPLDIFLGKRKVGVITLLGGDRSLFTFDEAYVADPQRPVLSLSFKSETGDLILDQKRTQTRLLPYFSNLLPEGPLRDYLARRAGVKSVREYYLLWSLGEDLPGAVIARGPRGGDPSHDGEPPANRMASDRPLRFSLAGVQLKFSAVQKARQGLAIPARGVGGSWIVKLPSAHFSRVAENEFSMMSLARAIGLNVPDVQLLPLAAIDGLPEEMTRLEGQAYAIRRFDRTEEGRRIHMEDFAQVFGVYPEEKYERASYRLIARVLALETRQSDVDEFIGRLVFNALIGNADMHLKNWTLLYPDGVSPTLSPAYDLVSTLAYIPDDKAALKVATSARWDAFDEGELRKLAAKASLPERRVLTVARDTVAAFRETWTRERSHLPIDAAVTETVERQLAVVPIAQGEA